MLDLPRLGCINAHGSLLPRWRGAAPIQWAIATGDAETGVTTMQMDAGLDTGAMLLHRAVPIGPHTDSPQLFTQLSAVSAALVVETLEALEQGSLRATPQDQAHATPAPLLTREDGLIDWSRTAEDIDRRFRGFQPWPGAFTHLRGKKLIVHTMTLADVAPAMPPGSIDVQHGTLVVCCGAGCVQLHDVQMEGKKRMPAADFLHGFQLKTGELLGK